MDDLVEWLTDANYAGPMQHMRDWLEIDLRHAQAAEALATRDARIAELERERDIWREKSGGIAVRPVLDSLRAAEARATAAEERLKEAERVVVPFAEIAKHPFFNSVTGHIFLHDSHGDTLGTTYSGDIRTAAKFMETADEPS